MERGWLLLSSLSRATLLFFIHMEFEEVYAKGRFYKPASKHYGFFYKGKVDCDRCGKKNLKSAFGYQKLDICLSCASQVECGMTF